MLKTGKEHLEAIRDGRRVYVGREKVDDVTTHPAFRNAAHTMAALYDMKADPANRDVMSYEEGGERYSTYYLRATSRADLQKRSEAHRRIADLTYGMIGRSYDHVSSFVAGMAMKAEVLDEGDSGNRGFARNLLDYYEHMRRNDVYATYAVLPPQAARDPDYYERMNLPIPTLRIVEEKDDGVVISGMKMLATSGVFCDEIWIGNLIPLAPTQTREAITCAIRVGDPGVTLWSRQPIEMNAANEFDAPLTYRYDETDSMVVCDNVKVPWEKVFVLDDPVLARGIYIRTPSHCYGNHQSNVRYLAKLRLLVGLCSRVAQATGADRVPAVRELLGDMAAQEACLAGMIAGQLHDCEAWPGGEAGYVCFNRRYMYAALNFCTQNYSRFVDTLRDLCGGGVFQMPASVDVMLEPELRRRFEQYWQTPQLAARDRMKLFKLAWDMVGSEFAGRHQQYEKFYAGASFIIRNHNYREAPWAELDAIVDGLLEGYDVPTAAELEERKRALMG